MDHITLSIFNYKRKKVCDIYDSRLHSEGQAFNVVLTKELNGWKELSFEMPYVINKKKNFRWDFIKNEFLIRVTEGHKKDWYIIHEPKKSKSSRSISQTVKCSHISSLLKTKNLYVYFDDTNGIGTLPFLIGRAIAGTDWSIGKCDTFYEKDGKTEKKRSLSSEGKEGAYKLIIDICNLFNAYPVFNGDSKTIDFHALKDKLPMRELTVGKNLNTLSADYNSESIVTRLYVEGEYGDHGYVGIDDVNPTGLTYLLNFDYYKQVGLFTDVHQAALDKYLKDMTAVVAQIKQLIKDKTEKDNALNKLWGQFNYMFYIITNGAVSKKIKGGEVKDEQVEIKEKDELIVLGASGPYRKVIAGAGGNVQFTAEDKYAIKYITKPSGTIGYQEVSIEAKEKLIKNFERDLAAAVNEKDKERIRQQIAKTQAEIKDIYDGTAEAVGLYANMHTAAGLVVEIDNFAEQIKTAQSKQTEVEVEFVIAMGDLLKDGYWSNTNYIVGQEEFLYQDSLDMSEQLAKPLVKYSVSVVALSEAMGFTEGKVDLNAKAKLYDKELNINDVCYVTKVTRYLDDPSKDNVEISNEDITLSGKTFDSLISRITNIADMIEQKNSLYDRADAITSDGKIFVDRLDGAIDILKNQLLSSTSGWYTDKNGNMMFEAVDGGSAMMLSGEGFMIADGKTPEGEWNFRSFGTGKGFTADAITTGYLSSARIEAGSITGDKIAAGSITADSGIIADASITNAMIKSLSASKLTAGTIDAGVINVNNLKADNITTGTINGKHIPVLGTEKIEDGAITHIKISANAIDENNLQDGSVTTNKIVAESITAGKLAADSVLAKNIKAGEITAGKLAANAVEANNIKANSISASKMVAGTITADSGIIAESAIGTTQIADGSITDAKIVELTANKITGGTINGKVVNVNNLNADNIVTGTINGQRIPTLGTEKLADGAVTGDKVAENAITSDKIVAEAITAGKLAANSVLANNIKAGEITAGKLAANAVEANNIAADSITTDKIKAQQVTASKLASDVGSSLDLSSNESINLKIGDINVGGENLFTGTEKLEGSPWLTGETYKGLAVIGTTGVGQMDILAYRTSEICDGEEYVLSFYGKSTNNAKIASYFFNPNTTTRAESSTGNVSGSSDGYIITKFTSDWKRYWIKWKQSKTDTVKDVIVCRLYDGMNASICGVKFEKGNKATDWSPSPKDPSSSVINTSVTLDENGIDMTGGIINVNAGTALNVQSGGKINVNAEDLMVSGESFTVSARNSVSVGGTNILPDSERERSTNRFLKIPVREIFEDHIGEHICISFEAKSSLGREIEMYPYQHSGISINSRDADGNKYFFTPPVGTFKRFSFLSGIVDYGDKPNLSKGSIGFYDQVAEQDYTIRRIKIEFGNKPTDWSPSPEDADKRISANETAISQNSKEIKTKASTEYVNGDFKESIKTQTSGQISSAIKEIKIGGNNLLPKTKSLEGHSPILDEKYKNEFSILYESLADKNSSGYVDVYFQWASYLSEKEYTFSFYAKADKNVRVGVYFWNDIGGVGSYSTSQGLTGSGPHAYIDLTSTWGRYWVTWNKTEDESARAIIVRIESGTTTDDNKVYVSAPKLEAGNKTTEWSPAPEDDEGRISANETAITQNTTAISERAKTTEVNAKFDSERIQTSQNISAAVNGIEIGGENLVPDTETMSWNSYVTSEKYKGLAVVSTVGAWNQQDMISFATKEECTSEEYVLSFYAKTTTGTPVRCFFYNPNTTVSAESSTGETSNGSDGYISVLPTSEWGRCWIKWKQTKTNARKSIIIGRLSIGESLSICGIKLEEGNKPTDWSPYSNDPVKTLKNSKVNIGLEGIDMSSTGYIHANAGGDVQITAKDQENSFIKFGNGDKTSFKVTPQDGVEADTIRAKNIYLNEVPVFSERKFIRSTTQPQNVHDVYWVKPNTAVSKTYSYEHENNETIGKNGRDFTLSPWDSSTLSGTMTYKISFSTYNNGSAQRNCMFNVTLSNGSGTVTFDPQKKWVSSDSSPSFEGTKESSVNLTSGAITCNIHITKEGGGYVDRAFLLTSPIVLTVSSNSGGSSGVIPCELFYIQ